MPTNSFAWLSRVSAVSVMCVVLLTAAAPAAFADSTADASQVPIATQIERAVQAGQTSVTIEPGEYRQDAGLSLSGHDGLTVNAYGVTLVMTKYIQAMSTGTSNDLTVNGLTINYDPLPFTQGRITSIASDFSSMKVQISEGYPHRLGVRMDVWNPDTRLPRAVIFDAKPTWVDQTTGAIRSSAPKSALVGDIVTYTWGADSGASFAVTVDGANTVLRDVTLHAAPGMGLMNAAGEGNTRLDGFHVTPGPLPPHASEAPILSTNWDAIQFQSVKHGPTVVNSTIVNAGDDSISIQGIGPLQITEVAGNQITATTSDAYRRVYVGDRLAQWVDGPLAIVKKVTGSPNSNTFVIDLDRPSPWSTNTDITDLDRRGSGFRFQNNTIDSSWRGLLLKSSDGVVSDNRIRGSNAIAVSPEDSSVSHARAGGHITITRNTFTSAQWTDWLWDTTQAGAVSINGWKPDEYSDPDITITDNTFQDIRGLNLQIKGAYHAVVERNAFTGPHQSPPGWQGGAYNVPTTAVVYVWGSDDVSFADNTIDWIGPYSITQVVLAPNASNVAGLHDGVKVLYPFLATQAGQGYTLTNRNSGLRLSPAATDQPGGTRTVQLSASDSPTQRWSLEPAPRDSVLIRNVLSGLYLTAATSTGATTLTQESLIAEPDAGSQYWQLLDVKNGYAKIVNVATGRLLAINGGTAATGATVVQAQNGGTMDQVWRIDSASPVFTADDPPLETTVGSPYGPYSFAATGDPQPGFRLSSGVLPDGVSLDPQSGVLSGVPTGIEDSTFTVSATSAGVETEGRSHTIRVRAASPVFTSDDPPLEATVGSLYGPYRLTASGKPAPEFQVSSGALPEGLTLDPVSGVLSGVPTRSGQSTFAVSAVSAGVETLGASHIIRVSAADRPSPGRSSTRVNHSNAGLAATGTYEVGGIATAGALLLVTGLGVLGIRVSRRRLSR